MAFESEHDIIHKEWNVNSTQSNNYDNNEIIFQYDMDIDEQLNRLQSNLDEQLSRFGLGSTQQNNNDFDGDEKEAEYTLIKIRITDPESRSSLLFS